ncbi:hypothetical protein F5X98DRAFT_348085 [Xylaria grammica]|nr:hypothetical protein F5X98DRAFT_348085 [Xylaria grammica]
MIRAAASHSSLVSLLLVPLPVQLPPDAVVSPSLALRCSCILPRYLKLLRSSKPVFRLPPGRVKGQLTIIIATRKSAYIVIPSSTAAIASI